MPQTVPNSPTNGAVEPTVARNASPSCSRLCTFSIARWIDIVIQSFMLTLPSSPTCLVDASSPDSAMKRNGLDSLSCAAPSCTLFAFQNVLFAWRACRRIFACSYTLVKITYQLPIDMNARMPSVIFATMSPPFHSASSPYGLSTISTDRVVADAFGAGATDAAGAAAVSAGAAADDAAGAAADGAAGVAGGVVCPCASTASGNTADVAATSKTAARAARRFSLDMLSPCNGCPTRWV